jgi:hypothetical protein
MVLQALAVGQVVSWIGTGPEAALGIGKRLADYVAWKKSVEIGKVDLPLDVSSYVHGVVSGFMNPVRVKENLKYHGYDADLYGPGFFQYSDRQFNNPDSMVGLQIEVAPGFAIDGQKSMNFLVFDTSRAIEGDDILTLLNRNNIDEATAKWCLEKQGVRDYGTQDALLSLRHEVPPVADLIRFAVRDAFFPDVIAAYGEADEYPTYIDKFIRWQGLGWETGQEAPPSTSIDGQHVPAHPATWGEIAWWAHWEFPSATQGYDMMFKLYGNSDYGPSPYVVTPNNEVDRSLVFDEDDLNRLLRASAYSNYWRKKLAAIASQPVNKGDLVRMLKQGLIDESQVYHTYRAQNYDDRTAKLYTTYTINQQKPDIRKEIMQMFELGIIDEQDAIDRMMQFNVSRQEAEFEIYHARLKLTISRVEERIKLIRETLLQGKIDINEARAALGGLGLKPNRIDEYVRQWQAEMQVEYRILTLRQLQSDYVDGVLGRDDMIGRLQRLRYTDEDVTLIMKRADQLQGDKAIARGKREDAETKRAKAEQEKETRQFTKQANAQAKAKQQAAARQEKLAKAAKTQIEKQLTTEQKAVADKLKEEQKVLAAGATDKNLQAYWKAGVIDLEGIRIRLAARNFAPNTIEKWIDTYILKAAQA